MEINRFEEYNARMQKHRQNTMVEFLDKRWDYKIMNGIECRVNPINASGKVHDKSQNFIMSFSLQHMSPVSGVTPGVSRVFFLFKKFSPLPIFFPEKPPVSYPRYYPQYTVFGVNIGGFIDGLQNFFFGQSLMG